MVKHITTTIITLITSLFIVNVVSALTYSDNVNMQFTFNPTISIDITGNLSIDELVPGGYSDSNIITVTTSSNNLSGYSLYSNIGNSNYNYTELRKSSNDNSNVFTNLTANKASLDVFDSDDSTWGYSYCNTANDCSNSTNWISGDYNNYNTGYNGLPLYNNGSSIKLADTDTNTTSTINFKIGARATSNQVSGTYTNVINFYAISKQPPTTFEDAYIANNKTKYNGYYTMQDMSTDICKNSNVVIGSTIELIDTRDNEVYRIAKLKDNNCWMIDNLNLGATALSEDLTSENTNFNNTISASTFNTWNKTGGTGTYTSPELIPIPGTDPTSKSSYGTLYNYCAASAGTYCSSSNAGSGNSEYDICPTHWRMPTGDVNGDLQTLYSNYNSLVEMTSSIFEGGASFSSAGAFENGSPAHTGNRGYYWSSTYVNGSDMRMLYFYSTPPFQSPIIGGYRRMEGYSVRCLAQ